MSASVNVPQYKAQPQYKPGPRFEAHKKPVDRIRARQDVNDVKNNEIPQPARLVQPQQQQQRPQAESLPRPQALIQPEAPRPKFEETVRSVGSKPDKVKVIDKGRELRLTGRELIECTFQKYSGEEKKGGIFDGIFKLPNFKLPWAGERRREQARPGVESDVEVVSMGVQPGLPRSSDKVPVHRTGGKEKGPQVYPSAFGGNSAPVVAVEQTEDNHFLGPRGLKFNKREADDEEEVLERSRRGLNDELGVASGYQVISEVDLAFKPSFEDGVGVTVFQGRILPEEIVYGVCLPATGFSVLFVLLSLLTVISVLVSGERLRKTE